MYRLEYLPSFEVDLIEAEDYLYEFSPAATYKLTEALDGQMATVVEHPLIYPAYRYNKKYRLMTLPYQYLCFYRVDEAAKVIKVYRLLREMQNVSEML